MKKIRKFFWPLLEKSQIQEFKTFNVNDSNVNDNNFQKVLDYSMKIYESELGRNSSIETKASLFIGTLAIITSVLLAITTTLIGQNKFSIALFFIVFILFFVIIYVLRTVWFAVKVHERQPFHTFYHSDILREGDEKEYAKLLITSLINKTKKNSLVINSKVNNMVMAQEYFKRAIVTLSIYSFFLIFFFLDKCKLGITSSIFKIVKALNEINIATWLIVLLILIAITSILINFILISRLKK
jgi:hypothetical protein